MTIRLAFDVDRVVAVERDIGRKLSEIVREAESDTGMALGTLRALLAAGTAPRWPAQLGIPLAGHDFARANGLLQDHGLAACAEAVGKALGAFIRRIDKAAA